MVWKRKGGGVSKVEGYLAVADGETEYSVGQYFQSQATGLFYELMVAGVVTEPSTSANCELRSQVDQVEVKLAYTAATNLVLRMYTSDSADYFVDWGDGNTSTGTQGVDCSHTFSGSPSGFATVRLALGSFCTQFLAIAGEWTFTMQSLSAINPTNTVTSMSFYNTTAAVGKITDFVKPGSALDHLHIQTYSMLVEVDIEQLYENAAVDYLYLLGAMDVLGDLSAAINKRPGIVEVLLLNGANVDVEVTDTFQLAAASSWVSLHGLDTAKIDLVLESCAAVDSWTWIQAVTISGATNGIPGTASTETDGWIDQIVAATGSPTVTVNS